MKKYIAMLLATFMLFGTSACGNTQDTNTSKVPEKQEQEKEEEQEIKEEIIDIPEYSVVRSEEDQNEDGAKIIRYFVACDETLYNSDMSNIFKDIVKEDTTYNQHCVYFYKSSEKAESDVERKIYISFTDDENGEINHINNPNVDSSGEIITEEAKIKKKIMEIATESYSDTSLFNIDVNENLGTDDENDYIVLAYPKWNVKNSASTTQEMLSMYSSDLAAKVGSGLTNVSEITIFWTVPYYSETETVLKYTYTRDGSKMFLTDTMVSNLLQ